MRGRIGAVAAIGAAVALGAPVAAGAVPTWSAASPLGAGSEQQDVAMGAHGDVAMAWASFVSGKLAAQVVTRPAGGSYSAALTLSPPGSETRAPVVGVDGAGEAVAAWPAAGANYIIEATTVSGAAVSAPQKLSAPGENAVSPAIAVDERGDAIVAWTRENGTENVVQASFRPAGGHFGAAVSLPTKSGNTMHPEVAIDAAGDATVVWERFDGAEEIVEAATRPAATGAFTAPVELASSSGNPMEPAVAMNAAGDTAVAWVSPGVSEVIQAATRPAGGSFGKPANLTGDVTEAKQPQVALDGQGEATVVWTAHFVVEYATGTKAGVFSVARGLAFEGWYPSVAEDAAGDTLVGYATLFGLDAAAVFRPAGGAFGASQQMSPVGQVVGGGPLNVAISEDGDGAFGFIAQGSEVTAEVGLLDSVGAALGNVSIPARATAGSPVTFSAAPVDAVFPDPAVTWAFGDSATASGDTVTHTFTAPGTYSVAVTATAAPGDSATSTATIVVVPAAVPAAPTFAAAALRSTTVTASRGGRVSLKVACPAGGAVCAGTVKLALPATASGLAVAARAQGLPVTVAAGGAAFNAAAGASTTVTFALAGSVLKLLKGHHRLTFTVALESHGGANQSATTSGKLVVKAYVKPNKSKNPRSRKK
ncbi:MAG TPA: PKD domain-containing protein [Solirubrobacteraceae bacterium]|nr:PKD domain-containing protein [Solirubrobacteraceae bacterium]